MLAARIEQEGSLDFIKVVDGISRPVLQPGQALIRVHAAGVNNSDIAGVRGYLKAISRVPRILGRDFSGVVEEINSENKEDYKWINSQVWGTDDKLGLAQDGTFAEYIQVPISSLVRKPSTIKFETAASLPLPWLCAYIAVYKLADTKETDRVLVIGSTGAIGSAICQMLRSRKVKCIYGTSRKDDQPQPDVQTILLDNDKRESSDSGLVEAVKSAADTRDSPDYLDVIIDCTGQESLVNSAISLLSPRGNARLIMMATSNPSGQFNIDMRSLYMKSVSLKGLSSNVLDQKQLVEALETITNGFQDNSYNVKYCNQIDKVPLCAGSTTLIQALEKASSSSRRRTVLTL